MGNRIESNQIECFEKKNIRNKKLITITITTTTNIWYWRKFIEFKFNEERWKWKEHLKERKNQQQQQPLMMMMMMMITFALIWKKFDFFSSFLMKRNDSVCFKHQQRFFYCSENCCWKTQTLVDLNFNEMKWNEWWSPIGGRMCAC